MSEMVDTSAKVDTEESIYTKDGTVDYKNNPANKKTTGTWKACPFILGKSSSATLLNFTFEFKKPNPVLSISILMHTLISKLFLSYYL